MRVSSRTDVSLRLVCAVTCPQPCPICPSPASVVGGVTAEMRKLSALHDIALANQRIPAKCLRPRSPVHRGTQPLRLPPYRRASPGSPSPPKASTVITFPMRLTVTKSTVSSISRRTYSLMAVSSTASIGIPVYAPASSASHAAGRRKSPALLDFHHPDKRSQRPEQHTQRRKPGEKHIPPPQPVQDKRRAMPRKNVDAASGAANDRAQPPEIPHGQLVACSSPKSIRQVRRSPIPPRAQALKAFDGRTPHTDAHLPRQQFERFANHTRPSSFVRYSTARIVPGNGQFGQCERDSVPDRSR